MDCFVNKRPIFSSSWDELGTKDSISFLESFLVKAELSIEIWMIYIILKGTIIKEVLKINNPVIETLIAIITLLNLFFYNALFIPLHSSLLQPNTLTHHLYDFFFTYFKYLIYLFVCF